MAVEMSVPGAAAPVDPAVAQARGLDRSAPLPRGLRYLATPIALALGCLALFLWIGSLELDSIEKRRINWDFISSALWQHVKLTGLSTVLVILIAVSLGVLLTRPGARALSPPVLAVTNIGQAIPSIGLLVLLGITLGIGFKYAVIALVAYSVLPVLRNTMVGLEQVDRSLIEAGRGMGMTKASVRWRIELPLAVPVILAGIRTALIINVGTATLATFTGAGGLGDLINNGLRLGRDHVILVGAMLTALLALTIDWIASVAEDILRPKGL
ncbi:MAG: ABC transporter permease [Solirubrobacteraceae bacterium]